MFKELIKCNENKSCTIIEFKNEKSQALSTPDNLNEFTSAYFKLNQSIKQQEIELKELKNQIISILTKKGENKVNLGNYKINYSTVAQQRFDTNNFKLVHPEIYKEFLKSGSYEKLVITKE